MLTVESGISPELIAARGYETATTKKRLEELGFAVAQRRPPALVLPLHGVIGEVVGYQIRPDDPRWLKNKAVKYETPKGAQMRLDIPPTVRQYLGDPAIPLFITEGIKKGDAIASCSTDTARLCVVALLGVWNWRGTNDQGGKLALPEWEDITLDKRPVHIIFDGDVSVKREVHTALERLVAFLTYRGAQVRCVYLPQTLNGKKCGIDDWLVSGKTLVDTLALAEPLRQSPGEIVLDSDDDAQTIEKRPEIRISPQINKVVDRMERAILEAPGGPYLYQRNRLLSFIGRGVQAPAGIERHAEAPVIVRANHARLRELAAQHASWWKLVKRKNEKFWEPSLPPDWCAPSLEARQDWRFPRLEGIVTAPTLRLDCSVLDRPGYDPSTGLFLDTNSATFPPVPTSPSYQDALAALDVLRAPFADFLFQQDSDKSVALAAVLSLLARYAIRGNVPLFAITSPVRGSGKGLLVDVITTIATGRPAAKWAETQDDEEERKRLLTLALEGDAAVVLDNLIHPLGSPALDMVLTSGTIKDRLLGTQTSKEAAISAIFFATGNNLTYAGDAARRVVPCCLDPQMERPEERSEFTYPDLLAWVTQERPRLVVAGLTILRAYHLAGRPGQKITPIGSFQGWSSFIRAALVWLKAADPATGREGIEAENDPHYEKINNLFLCWEERLGKESLTLASVISRIKEMTATDIPGWDAFQDALGAFDTSYDGKTLKPTRIGNALRGITGRIVNNRKLNKAPGRSRQTLWSLVSLVSLDESLPLDAGKKICVYQQTNIDRSENVLDEFENPLDGPIGGRLTKTHQTHQTHPPTYTPGSPGSPGSSPDRNPDDWEVF